jgi:hypothetical protein
VARPLLAAVALAALSASALAAQPDPKQVLLGRTAAYLLQFVARFSNVVAEEQYVQQTTSPRRTRRLRSDFLFVMFPGATQWFPFRDVLDVDGKPVREEERQRLMRLFLEPPANMQRREDELRAASARYNLTDIGTLNNPVLALAFLQAGYQEHFRFTLGPLEKSLGPGVRTVRFEEILRPTIMRAGSNRDLPAQGLVWIEEGTGAVVKTELQAGLGRFPSRITTSFVPDADLQLRVPSEMREWHPDRGGEITGVATYGRFRRFQVQTDATVDP